MSDRIFDFHTHTFLSDGELSPVELIRRAAVRGYAVIALTDHAGPGNAEFIVRQLVQDCAFCEKYWDIRCLPGIELTHVPAAGIDEVAGIARAAGARIVVVHGETPVEPVEPGTNLAAIKSIYVDVLGHPGLLTDEEAQLAAENGTFLELSARGGHSLTNGHVARVAQAAGARLLVNSDTHSPRDILTAELARRVALGAGLDESMADQVLRINPTRLLGRLESITSR